MATNTKTNFMPFILLAVLVFGMYYMNNNRGGTKPDGPDVPSPISSSLYPEPADAQMRSAVSGITEALKNKESAIHLAAFYRRVALTMYSEANNSEQARFIHQRSGENLARVAPYTTYHPTIQPIAEQFVTDVCTTKNIKLGETEKANLKNAFMAIAWACWMASDQKAYTAPPMLDDAAWNTSRFSGLVEDDDAEYERMLAIEHEVPAGVPGINPEMTMVELTAETAKQNGNLQFPANRGPPENPITHGLVFDEAEFKEFAEHAPRFADLGYGDTGVGKVRLLYTSLLKYDPEAFTEKQTTGDCTSHATRNACDVARAFEIDVLGQHESFVARGATEPIYAFRGHGGEGMSVYRAVNFIQESGGIAIRKQYGKFDLSQYNGDIGTNWGKQGGPPPDLVSEVRKHQAAKASLVKTVDEARDAIYNGFPLIVGSDHSYSSKRDENGIAARTTQGWAHAMAWVGVDDSMPDGPWFLIVNSWGRWNGGPKGKYDIPDGAFWISARNAATMIDQKQAVAVGNVNGFEPLPLENWGFDYLTERPESTAQDDTKHSDPYLTGITEVSASIARLTIPDDVGNDGEDESGKYTPDTCPRKGEDCKGGWTRNGDGHMTPCPLCNPDGKYPRTSNADHFSIWSRKTCAVYTVCC